MTAVVETELDEGVLTAVVENEVDEDVATALVDTGVDEDVVFLVVVGYLVEMELFGSSHFTPSPRPVFVHTAGPL